MNAGAWRGRRVLLTGHTGFKGSWLSLWLAELGAEVHGFALPPATAPAMFDACRVAGRMASSTFGDVRDPAAVDAAVARARPEVVLHLAAQPLVRASYRDPVGTYATNVMGAVHVLDAVRRAGGVRAAVCVTSDKCYENDSRPAPYAEHDPLGGHDPYSSSKGCQEIVTAAYGRSFLRAAGTALATGRAGNVIGGGDWAEDRLVPDLVRAWEAGRPIEVRSPASTRPWQHVLEPLSGYLLLAERLMEPDTEAEGAWNFGPGPDDVRTVESVLDRLCPLLPGASWRHGAAPQLHEASLLALDSSKARGRLGWTPRWSLDEALDATAAWYGRRRAGEDMAAFTLRQLHDFASAAGAAR